jgi:hypothetical protein
MLSARYNIAWKEGCIMAGTSDSAYVVIYSILVSLLMVWWTYVPA